MAQFAAIPRSHPPERQGKPGRCKFRTISLSSQQKYLSAAGNRQAMLGALVSADCIHPVTAFAGYSPVFYRQKAFTA